VKPELARTRHSILTVENALEMVCSRRARSVKVNLAHPRAGSGPSQKCEKGLRTVRQCRNRARGSAGGWFRGVMATLLAVGQARGEGWLGPCALSILIEFIRTEVVAVCRYRMMCK
jgi:hypothetical protein